MNAFTTDHPMMSGPSPAFLRWQRRLLRASLILLLSFPIYLLLLGPYSALSGTGRLDFLPQQIRDALFFPAAPVYLVPGLRSTYDDYLHRWYRDPNEADPETGWY